jgi:hypothetical protein
MRNVAHSIEANIMEEFSNKQVLGKNVNEHLWEVWAFGPKTKDAELLLKWSKTSFFAGSPIPDPKPIDGKDFMLYHRCSDEAWARKRFEHAKQYFTDIRLMVDDRQVEAELHSTVQHNPDDDMLGEHGKLSFKGGSC